MFCEASIRGPAAAAPDLSVSALAARPRARRAGAFSPKDVTVPAGYTGMEPGKTSFFQALGIPTKIARGTIETVSDVVKVLVVGDACRDIFDSGNAFSPSVLDVDEQELIDRFLTGIKTIAALSLVLKYPTLVSVTHSLVNVYKNLIAVSLATEYTFEGSEKVNLGANPTVAKKKCNVWLQLSPPFTRMDVAPRLLDLTHPRHASTRDSQH
ncbi:hypothetical protein B0H11DRAFT_2230807 [Mycena galericulata]|nr:hypothetical protein B0H11DRAFT_2230807 [Mycena galericulata]